jgi:hypothetical protein
MRRLATFGLLAFLALAFGSAAHAALIAEFIGTTPSGSNTSYNYNLLFSTQNGVDRLEAGSGTITPGAIGSADFITLYDVASTLPGGNFVSATAGPGFSLSLQNSGIDAAQTVPLDDLSLANVTYKYLGPPISTDTVFGGFSIVVNNNDGTTLKQFTGQYTDNSGPEINTKISEIGLVAVPRSDNFIPEPSAMMLGLMAVGGLMGRRKRR